MVDNKLTAVASAIGGSGGKPGRCCASVAGPQADDTRVPAIALRTTRPTTNALRAAHATAPEGAFTLAELLVSVGVLVVLVLLFTQLLNSTASITTLGHKRMDTDSQARQVLDRMAIDFAQLVKRTDLDFFAKGTIPGGAMAGNDRIAFYSAVPGYYPPTGSQSPVSLVAYRVNSDSASSSYNKLQRMGKGLVWNGVSSTDKPVVFMPLTISATWPAAVSSTATDSDCNNTACYEIIGPQVFRFEYCYLGTDGTRSITPPGFSSLAAIIVDIAVIDPKSRVLLGSTEAQINAQIATLAAGLSDYAAGMAPGQLRTNWQTYLDGITNLPRPAISSIRLYERALYFSPPAP